MKRIGIMTGTRAEYGIVKALDAGRLHKDT